MLRMEPIQKAKGFLFDLDGGIPGILVKTGKYHKGMVESSGINLDGFLHSIADVPNILNS